MYSSYPLLVDKKNRTEASISGKTISDAFKAYRKWYKMLKRIGKKIRFRKIMPLDGTTIEWY